MKLKNLLITTKLLLILGLFATAFLTSGGIVFWSWRQIDRTNQYLAHNYYPVMNACTNVLLDLAAARTEIYRYLGHYESSPSRVAESLDRARERLGWMAQQAQRPDIKAAISQLLALVQQYQKELAHLVRVQEQSPGMQASQLSNRLLELEGSALQVTNNLITELGTQVQADTLSTSTLFSRYLWQAGLVAALYCGLGLGLIFIISRDLRQGIGFVLSGLQVFVREHREPFPVTERNDELGHIAAEFQQMVRDLLSVEQALQDSEARYQAIVEGFDGLICVCSPDYRIEFMNRKFIERT
ncbi:MAG: hypothetical protein FJ135_15365, partial [Deltaproteobacteria bacterium]|nr:hypothetical protein [Deltaproteobacteria bacterium]